jgi:hypothetical protein
MLALDRYEMRDALKYNQAIHTINFFNMIVFDVIVMCMLG